MDKGVKVPSIKNKFKQMKTDPNYQTILPNNETGNFAGLGSPDRHGDSTNLDSQNERQIMQTPYNNLMRSKMNNTGIDGSTFSQHASGKKYSIDSLNKRQFQTPEINQKHFNGMAINLGTKTINKKIKNINDQVTGKKQ